MKNFKIIITRHPGLVEYLKEEGIISEGIQVSSHASPELVTGKHVIGVLPHSLPCLTASFSEVPLRFTPEMRGQELTCQQIRAIAGKLVTYSVKEVIK